MAYTKGGKDTNLVQAYAIGEDADIDYGRHRWLAQTFTITDKSVCWRFRVKSWTRIGDRFYHYAIRATDPLGMPTGPDLYHTTLSPTGEAFYAPGKWQRFDFDEFPTLPPGTYAIVLSVPDSPGTWQYKARADGTSSLYAEGRAWRSDDSGATWNKIPNTDLIFEVWGWPPPPAPPPTPSLSNVSVRQVTPELIPDAYRLIVSTDILCHLYMRWTLKKPRIHDIPVLRRGIQMHGDRYFCFTVFEDNEQEEAGDTLVHTFIKPNWPYCQTRYFYFWATVATIPQPSTSAIFKLHRQKKGMILIFQEPWTTLPPTPPEMEQIFFEPWTAIPPGPPEMELIFFEPWSSYFPVMELIYLEPWTYFTPPAPPMEQIYFEPWSG
ncbi:hypothetical protein ES708_11524 [subsurface metagenome]